MATFSYVPTVAREILYNYHLKRFGRYVCKDRRWISIIRDVEFQRVGRTIIIKSKMFLFPYTLIISTRIFKL